MRTRIFKFPAKAAKTSVYLITAAVAAFTVHSLSPNSLTDSPLISPAFSADLGAALNGVVRSSRALCTITINIVDYKYSLHGLSVDSDEYRRILSEVHLRSAKRILSLCEANKGFYVKAGQFAAAMRQVPKEYSSTLSSLQDQAVPCHFKSIKEVLTSNLGQNLSDIFLSLDEQPIAAASIAQVHRALLKDHQEVAVKVQYPVLEHQMKLDLATMSFLSKSVSWFFPEYRFQWMISEFVQTIAMELDFNQEARNSERTAKNFKNKSIEFTTKQVLTMQYCTGGKIPSFTMKDQICIPQNVDDLEFLKKMGINPVKVAKALVEVFAEMIFVHGFLHGDPHPGNILVSPKGPDGFSLVLLDHGVYKEFGEEFRLNYCQLWKALILLDSNKILQLGKYFGVGKYARYFPLIFTGRTIDSKSALGAAMSVEERENLRQELKSLRVEDYSSFLESLPSEFLTILRTDGLLRSILSKLGSSQKIRILAYAKYALHGLSPKLDPENDSMVKVVFCRCKTSITYLQLRFLLELLALLSRVEVFRQSLSEKFRMMTVFVDHILRNLFFLALEP